MKAISKNSFYDIKTNKYLFFVGEEVSFERKFVHAWTKRYLFEVTFENGQKKEFSKESFEFYFDEEKIYIDPKKLFVQALGALQKKKEIAFAREIIKKYPEDFDFSARG